MEKQHKRVSLGRKTIRIEAPGCIIYVEKCVDGGTRVDVIPDGDRFAGSHSAAEVCQPNGRSVVVHVTTTQASN